MRTFEWQAEMFSTREYFSASLVHHGSRIARQSPDMDWSIGHERREASFWISVRNGFTHNTFSGRRRSPALAGCRQAPFVFERNRYDRGSNLCRRDTAHREQSGSKIK